MKIVIAADSFKGCAEASVICDLINEGIYRVLPDAEVVKLPLADGGEGTLQSLYLSKGGSKINTVVTSPMGFKVGANILQLNSGDAVVEMAMASGHSLISKSNRNPLVASTYGTGELILAAVNYMRNSSLLNTETTVRNELFSKVEKKKIYVAIGGSATNDCGMGMAAALGYKFYDLYGDELLPFAENMIYVDDISKGNVNERIFDYSIIGLCDVRNRLYGDEGATKIFGKQKGVNDGNFEVLEEGMKNMARVISEKFGVDVSTMEMCGAGGGFAAGLVAFCNAKLIRGIDVILEAVGFNSIIQDADLIITGEGRFDSQSAYGKVVSGVINSAKNSNIPVLVVAGSVEGSITDVGENCNVVSISSEKISVEESIRDYKTLIPNIIEIAVSRIINK